MVEVSGRKRWAAFVSAALLGGAISDRFGLDRFMAAWFTLYFAMLVGYPLMLVAAWAEGRA